VADALKRLRDASVRVQGVVLTGVDFDKYQSYQGFFKSLPAKKSRQYYATFN
jgi:succinoglycan biosynthesis transport protein ExoP